LIYPDQAGMFARIAQTIGRHGGDLCHIDLLGPTARLTTRGVSIRARDEAHLEQIVAAVRGLDKVKVVDISDPGVPKRGKGRDVEPRRRRRGIRR
jgi:hypothetical protein